MLNAKRYLEDLPAVLREKFGERLVYVGLQGSYLRGEATEESDIDIMVVVEDLQVEDLAEYRAAIEGLECPEKSCGFLCGKEDLLRWNPLEICHLLHTTEDHVGVLAELVPKFTREDATNFVKLGVNNLFHEICHRYIHGSREKNETRLAGSYRQVFFLLQNLYFLESGKFLPDKRSLQGALTGEDRRVLETAMALQTGQPVEFDRAFSELFRWCKGVLERL